MNRKTKVINGIGSDCMYEFITFEEANVILEKRLGKIVTVCQLKPYVLDFTGELNYVNLSFDYRKNEGEEYRLRMDIGSEGFCSHELQLTFANSNATIWINGIDLIIDMDVAVFRIDLIEEIEEDEDEEL